VTHGIRPFENPLFSGGGSLFPYRTIAASIYPFSALGWRRAGIDSGTRWFTYSVKSLRRSSPDHGRGEFAMCRYGVDRTRHPTSSRTRKKTNRRRPAEGCDALRRGGGKKRERITPSKQGRKEPPALAERYYLLNADNLWTLRHLLLSGS